MVRRVRADLGIPDPKEAALKARKAEKARQDAAAATAASGTGASGEATTSVAPAAAPVVEAAAEAGENGPPSRVAGDVFASCVREVCVMLLKDKVPSYVQVR
jgi:hypothetical protein